ncbi:MAG: PKD domain-containing protein [Planctomycetota bacterium]|jgi:murein DD-endopeptidase MepM/ murein hydrolase activator NlpD
MAFIVTLLLLLIGCASGGETTLQGASPQDVVEAEEFTITDELLAGRRFEFSWKSGDQGGVNGIALLGEGGRIEGIGSPNETFWLVDQEERLIFKHADGRISTRYDEVRMEDGLLCFEGPFFFREGITHFLIEAESAATQQVHRMTPEEAAKIKYSTQRFVYLDIGESHDFHFKDGRSKRIHLVSVEEFEDSVVGLQRRAEVIIEINGKRHTLICAPYVMPIEAEDLRIQADTTSAWLEMPKRVQFSLWDASEPIVDRSQFSFPLPGYRLFSHGLQAYNEPVHMGHKDGDPAGGRFHHNYGVDFAGYEGRQKVVSCIAGEVVHADRREGDLSIRDDAGFILYYGHLDAILSGIEAGARIERGQWVGMLGRRGASGNFAHLHVGAYLSDSAMNMGRLNRNLNLYPWLIAAYQKANPAQLHAVARPHKVALTGDRVIFDAASSMTSGSKITSYTWEFHDKTTVNGSMAEKTYEKPGCYMATLWVEDDQDRRDVDFCKVKVYSRSTVEDVIPTLFVTYTPSLDVRVNQPVYFRIWPQGLHVENIAVDFGDGTVLENYRPYSAITHRFKEPGIHIVTVTGRSGTLPVAQKVKVVVRDV